MAYRYLLESGSPDGYLLEDGSGVVLLESGARYWFEASTSSCFTDTSGLTAVTADGDLVAAIRDKYTNEIIAVQATSGSRPTYRTGGGKPYLEFGGSHYLASSSELTLTNAGGEHSVGSACYFNSNTGIQNPIDADNFGGTRLSQFYRNNAGTPQSIAFSSGVTPFTDSGPSITAATGVVLSEITSTTTVEVFVNGTGDGSTGTTGPMQAGVTTLWIGASGSGSGGAQFLTGRFYGFYLHQAAIDSTTHSTNVAAMTALMPAGATYNDTLSESAASAAALANAQTFANAATETAAAADSLDPAGSSFGVPLGETAAAAASVTSTQAFVNALAESSTANDGLTGGLLLGASLNETVAAADAAAAAVTWGASDSESAAANDSLATSATFGAAASESAAAGDAASSSATMPNALGETSTAGASPSSSQIFASTLSESAAAAATPSTGATTYSDSLTEAAATADALAAGVTGSVSLNETAATGAAQTVQATFGTPIGESAAAADAASSSAVMGAAIGETSTAGASPSSTAVTNDAVNENLAALSSLGVGLVLPASVAEAAAAADAQAARVDLAGSLEEQVTANDNVVGVLSSDYPAGPVNPARIGKVAAAGRTGRVAGSLRTGIVNRASGRGRVA